MTSVPPQKSSSDFSLWSLARRNAVFYLRKNILFCAGCAVSVIILVGALLVGTSLKGSLRGLFEPRLGDVRWVLASSAGTFRASIADSIGTHLDVKAAPVLMRVGSVGIAGGSERVHRVNIIGVDEKFWGLGRRGDGIDNNPVNTNANDSSAIINSSLAEKLNINPGDQIILRFQTTGSLAMDAPFGLQENLAALRLPVSSIVGREQFGDFSLKAEHFAVYNVFVPLAMLQSVNDISGMASSILISESTDKSVLITEGRIIDVVQKSLSIKDAGLNLRDINGSNGGSTDKGLKKLVNTDAGFEIYSDHVFINDNLKDIIINTIPQAIPVSTWFVNSINRRDRSTPYSFVSTSPQIRRSGRQVAAPTALCRIEDYQIALTDWTAKDLGASVGDTVALTYFVPRSTSGLRIDTSIFIVSTIFGDTASWLNKSLMPPYPGLADAGSCADWNPSIPVDLSKIRPKDEEYWERYEGTPKAVISYDKAARIWGNRFGVTTSIRVPDSVDTIAINTAIASSLTPVTCGMRLVDIRSSVNTAINDGTDFAPLFAGLSFFTLAASLMLIWLLSTLHVKSRADEHYVLTAMGYSRKRVLQIYLSEGLFVFSVGCVIGILLAPVYTLAIIKALKTVWRAAAQTPELRLRVEVLPVIYGCVCAFACALVSMLVPIINHPALRAPLRGGELTSKSTSSPLTRPFNRRGLVLRNIFRDKRRVFGEMAILACALFVLGTTQLFHQHAPSDPALRSSGTGGFTLYGELASGIPYDETGAQFLSERGGVDIGNIDFISVPMRVKDGDDASCLSLNRSQSPVLLGVDQSLLDSIGAFSADKKRPWQILGAPVNNNTVYGIADANTIVWGLGKSVGDTVKYINESGDTLNVILAAGLKNSILQGKIIIAESDFIGHYPSTSGYRLLLLSTPPGKEKGIISAYHSYHDKSGLQLESTAARLSAFNAVENTYLSIFALLGVMGLALGCAGLGIVAARDVEGRRREFAVLSAQGFGAGAVRGLLFAEHAAVAAAGAAAGLVPAFIVSVAAVNIPNLLRIAGLVVVILSFGMGSIALGLRRFWGGEPVAVLKEEG